MKLWTYLKEIFTYSPSAEAQAIINEAELMMRKNKTRVVSVPCLMASYETIDMVRDHPEFERVLLTDEGIVIYGKGYK